MTRDKFINISILSREKTLKTTQKSLSLELFFLRGSSKQSGNQVELPVENLAALAKDIPNVVSEELLRQKSEESSWRQMLGLISGKTDPILQSIFKQAKFGGVDGQKQVQISFANQFIFFEELIYEKRELWQKYLKQVFGEEAILNVSFDAESGIAKSVPELNEISQPVNDNRVGLKHSDLNGRTMGENARKRRIDVSDKEKWPLANQILEFFPGQVYEVNE